MNFTLEPFGKEKWWCFFSLSFLENNGRKPKKVKLVFWWDTLFAWAWRMSWKKHLCIFLNKLSPTDVANHRVLPVLVACKSMAFCRGYIPSVPCFVFKRSCEPSQPPKRTACSSCFLETCEYPFLWLDLFLGADSHVDCFPIHVGLSMADAMLPDGCCPCVLPRWLMSLSPPIDVAVGSSHYQTVS